MVTAIGSIETQGDYQEKTFTENGTYTPDAGYDAFSQVTVNVQSTGSNPLQDMLDRSSNTDGGSLFRAYGEKNLFMYLTYEDLTKLDFSNKHYTSASNMFYNCSSLTTIPQLDFSSATNANSMFRSCSSLTTIPQLNFGNVTDASNMFYNCTSLTTIPQLDFSSATNADNTFISCTSLTTLDFSNIKTIGKTFAYTSSLSTLIIRNPTTLTTLKNTNAFLNTPIASKTGYIYVPDDLVDSYKQATNWSTYASQIKGLSELPQGE